MQEIDCSSALPPYRTTTRRLRIFPHFALEITSETIEYTAQWQHSDGPTTHSQSRCTPMAISVIVYRQIGSLIACEYYA
jgi:hypothetical protein